MTEEERKKLLAKILEANRGKEFFLIRVIRDFYTKEGRAKYN